MIRTTRFVLAALLVMAVAGYSDSSKKLELKSLEGDWEGVGQFIVPMTNMTMSVEGQARFDYDTSTGFLRTAMTGEKFLFTYADSGYLRLNPQSDSISWEVWDNFGKHALYFGRVSGNKIIGDRYKKDDHYVVMIELVTNDSIDFSLTITKPDGDEIEKAAFNLWRVKE